MIRCMECGQEVSKLSWSHLRKHDMTIEDYKKKYSDALTVSEEYVKRRRENARRYGDGVHKQKYPREERTCLNPDCEETFVVRVNEKRQFCSKRCGLAYNHLHKKVGMYGRKQTEKHYKIVSRVTRERNLKNWSVPEYRIKMEEMLRSQASYAASMAIKTVLNNRGIEFESHKFMSKEEMECYKYLRELGFSSNEIDTNFSVGEFYVDFFVAGVFIEYHPCNWWLNEESYEDYVLKRRKLLDENGYDNDLIVIQSTNDFNKLEGMLS